MYDQPDASSATQNVLVSNYTLTTAITEYVARGTQLKEYGESVLEAGYSSASSATNSSLSRLMSYMIDNAKGRLTYTIMQVKDLFYSENRDEYSSRKTVIIIVLVTDPLAILMLMVIFVPFILKVQSSLLKIYLHLCSFKDTDIKKWLDECFNSTDDIKASITSIKQIYEKQTFEIFPVDESGNDLIQISVAQMVRVKEGEILKSTPPKDEKYVKSTLQTGAQDSQQNTTMKTIEVTGRSPDDETAPIIPKDDMSSERKQEMFSRMNREKTKIYLVYLLLFALYLGVFKAVDGYIFAKFYTDTGDYADIMQLLSAREHTTYASHFFFREDLRLNKVHTFFDCIPHSENRRRQRRNAILHAERVPGRGGAGPDPSHARRLPPKSPRLLQRYWRKATVSHLPVRRL